MKEPPPKDLNDWPKDELVRELTRLRTILSEHTESPGDDPHVGATDGDAVIDTSGGDPYARNGVLVDVRRAVLTDELDVSLVDDMAGGTSAFIVMSGRINYSTDRVQHAYLTNPDGVAAIVSELVGLATRAASDPRSARFTTEFLDALEHRMGELP